MSAADNLSAKGTVIGVMSEGAYRVELGNGHRCVARTSGAARAQAEEYTVGAEVSLEFHPYDLSRGRIVHGTNRCP